MRRSSTAKATATTAATGAAPASAAASSAAPAGGGTGRSQSARREERVEAAVAPATATSGTGSAAPSVGREPTSAQAAVGQPTAAAARRRDTGPQEGRARRPRGSEQPTGRTPHDPPPSAGPAATAATAPAAVPQRSPQRRRLPLAGSAEAREASYIWATAHEASVEPGTATTRAAMRSSPREPSNETEAGRPGSSEVCDASNETDSFDEEAELLRCQADLVEAAAELGTTSADDELLTTDPDIDDDEDGLGVSVLPVERLSRTWQRPSVASVVIEEDDEDLLSGLDDDGSRFEVGNTEIRSRLWAQSLLRLKRSIDEIYSLCEFESDETLCERVQAILEAASKDFSLLMQQLHTQQEYALLAGDYPFKSSVAWTTRTPRASRSGESALEQLERVQLSSPSSSTGWRPKPHKAGSAKRRSSSFEPKCRSARLDDVSEAEEARGCEAGDALSAEFGKAEARGLHTASYDQLQLMVQTALDKVHSRLGQAPNRPSPEELLKRSEDRQRRAQQLRASQDDQRMMQLRQTENKLLAARERRQERAQQKQRDLLEKMTRARRQYQDQLRIICQRARKENRKTAEVAFIAKEALKSEKEILTKKQETAHISRALAREQMRKKLIESANRVAKVSENKRRQWETWQSKVQQELEEKERLASQRRREHIHSIRLKSQGQESRSELARGKRRELQEEDERNSQDLLKLSGKHMGRLALNCDGLPDGVREEVVEQLHQAAAPPASLARRGGGVARGSRQKTQESMRCGTPPPGPTHSVSPKGSPKPTRTGAAEVPSGEKEPSSTQLQAEQALTHSLPALPSTDELDPLGFATGPATVPESPALNSVGEVSSGGPVPADPSTARDKRRPSKQSEKARSSPARAASATALRSARLGRGAAAAATTVGSTGQAAGNERPSPLASDGSDDEQACEVWSFVEGTLQAPAESREDEEATARLVEALRGQLASEALPDEEALRVACEPEGSKSSPVSSSQRAKIVKLTAELGKALGSSSSGSGSGAAATVADAASQNSTSAPVCMNFERVDSLLADFCKVLGQFQRDADYALVLKLGCTKTVLEICCKIKDSLGVLLSSAGERNAAWRQTSNAMLSALKWLGLVSKVPLVRIFLLLTNRVLLLADIAFACLDAHFGAVSPLPESQSISVLFLPQLLHMLSLHVKQPLPDSTAAVGVKQTLVSCLLLSGLCDKLRELFKRAEVRGMRLFDGASPVPLLLLRTTGFLGSLVGEYSGGATEEPIAAGVVQVLRRTELFGVVSVLVSILFSEGRRGSFPTQAPKLPQTVTSLSVQAVRILNQIARIDLMTLQETLGACRQQELYHLLVFIFDYCTSRLHAGAKAAEETDLLHETIVLLGHYCLQRNENQGIMCYGEGQTLLTKITSLPLSYFMDERGKSILFPTILATCFGSERNLECLRNEMNMSLLRKFLAAQLSQKDDARPADASTQASSGRFPLALCQEALAFFSDEPPAAVATAKT